MLIFQYKSKWLWIQLILAGLGVLCWLLLFTPLCDGGMVSFGLKNIRTLFLDGEMEAIDRMWRFFDRSLIEGLFFLLFLLSFFAHPFVLFISLFMTTTRLIVLRRLLAGLDTIYAFFLLLVVCFFVTRHERLEISFMLVAFIFMSIALWLPVAQQKIDVDAIIAKEEVGC